MQKNYNENLVAGAAIRDDKGRRISKLFEAPHPKMTVGYAKNLIMPNDPTEQEFNFRQAGGGVIEDGVAVIDKVKGNSVVWNQLIKDFREPSNWLTGGNDVTVVGDKIHIKFASASSSNAFGVKSSAFLAGHKYYVLMNNENAVPLTAIKLGSASSGGNSGSTLNLNLPAITAAIPTSSESAGALWFWASDETRLEGDFSNIFVIDLTQMFGAGNEPSTYEEFLQRKPFVEDEFAYNEGEIINNKVEKVVTTGRNLWDEEWESGGYNVNTGEKTEMSNRIRSASFIPCSGNTTYYFKSPATMYALWYDSGKSFISSESVANRVKTSPADACFLTIMVGGSNNPVISYGNDICINLSDPTINGQYFPYEKHELDLSWIKDIKDAEGVKLFEDGMKSAGTTFDEVGKNKAVKRIEIVDLGSLIWKIDSRQRFEATIPNTPNKKPAQSTDVPNALLIGYLTDSSANMYNHVNDKTVGFDSSGRVKVYDTSYTSLVDFQTAMQGQNLYYELAEPIEVEYDEKSLTYPVVAGGTEEAIASEPSTAFRADIGYGIDAVKTILDLKARVEALEGK